MNVTLTTSLDSMTYKQYIYQPMPMIESIINRRLYKNNELIKTLDNVDLTLHMGPYENGREDLYDSSDEHEYFLRFSVRNSNTFSFFLMISYSYLFTYLKS